MVETLYSRIRRYTRNGLLPLFGRMSSTCGNRIRQTLEGIGWSEFKCQPVELGA